MSLAEFHTGPATRTGRIATLDGWRAVAILFVIVDHASRFCAHPWPLAMDGGHGVDIFFVLSGYLITSRLLGCEFRDLRQFYLRRAFRLWPVAWLFLAVVAALGIALPSLRLHWRDIAANVLFYRNYCYRGTGLNALAAGHFWSLAVEEQFYLLWPPLLLWLKRGTAFWAACAIATACALFRLAHWSEYAADPNLIFRTQVHADTLLVGCALALALSYTRVRAAFIELAPLALPLACIAFLLELVCFGGSPLTPAWESIMIAVMLACTSLRPQSPLGRVLETRPLRWLGLLSYSLYVWQQLFLRPGTGPVLLMLSASLLVAWLSYRLIEQPGVALGRRQIPRHAGRAYSSEGVNHQAQQIEAAAP